MPNGGSDCCATCWFNPQYEAYHETSDGPPPSGPTRCTIRDLTIPDPFWTYCANHPYHNPNRVDVPLGPVYVTDGYPYTRRVWQLPPDTEASRRKLVEVIEQIDNRPREPYPAGLELDEEAIKQAVALRVTEAIPALLRILTFDLEPWRHHDDFAVRNNAYLVGFAAEAVLELGGDDQLPHVRHLSRAGIEDLEDEAAYDPERDGLAVIRYHLIRGLAACSSREAVDLLKQGTRDPHPQIRTFATHILETVRSRNAAGPHDTET